MLVQAGGAALILGTSIMWGVFMSAKNYYRIKDLREMKRAFSILISEIDYGQTPLSEATMNVSAKCAEPIGRVFKSFSEGLLGKVDVYLLWSATVESMKDESYFLPEDLEMFKSFGKTLGYLDSEMQVRNIEMQIDYITHAIDELEKIKDKSRKMYLSLGALSGLMTIIVLL